MIFFGIITFMMPTISHFNLNDSLEIGAERVLKVNDLEDLQDITIVRVSGQKDTNYAVWKEMIEKHHYLQSAKLYGRQLKYLVKSSEHNWIGALSFSSASWRLKPRDEGIGWNDEERKKNLDKLICNSRFLILSEFGVKNLASYVMSLCLRRLPDDWEKSYNVRPLLVESFVDSEKFLGVCYRASNWKFIGETKGRGRNDRFHQNNLAKKHIFMYEIKKGVLRNFNWNNGDDWVSEEFRHTKLANKAKKN